MNISIEVTTSVEGRLGCAGGLHDTTLWDQFASADVGPDLSVYTRYCTSMHAW